MERWLRNQRPDIYRRLTGSDIPSVLQEAFFKSLAKDDYRKLRDFDASPKSIETDLLIVTPQFSPDMIKDVIAIRSQRPELHITLVMGPQWWGGQELAERVFDEIVSYGNGAAVDLINVLSTITSPVTIIRGARLYLDVVAALFSPGRMIFRSEEFNCAMPGYDPDSEVSLAERYLVEHASSVYHYWGDEGSEAIKSLMNVSGQIEDIPPACIEELGPHEILPKLSATDGAMHMVFAGDVIRIDGRPEHLDKWTILTDQGIHIHYYNPTPSWRTSNRAAPYLELASQSKFFHVEQTVGFERLLVELTQYDWAYLHIPPKRSLFNPGFENVASNLFLTFIQAELPIFIRKNFEFTFLNRVVDGFGAGLAVETNDLADARSKMQAALKDDMPDRLAQLKKAMCFKRDILAELVIPTGKDSVR
jgi:hypothetical protein